MHFKQFYLGCLAHASYLVGSDGEAAVIDPQRDVEQYVDEAERQGLKIRYVVETHLHADFVSGHRELAQRTGAEIVFGPGSGASFPHKSVKDGDELRIGKVVLRVLETPGHTPEGISLLVVDTEVSDMPLKVLTGDTLFIGDVGRPDLAGSKGYTPQQMAVMLHDSLHQKLLTLDDVVEVYPAHGAGSMCGRNISSETSSTIGQQRLFNYALQPMGQAEFVRMMTDDLPEAPKYFSRDAEINRSGAVPLEQIPRPAALSAEAVDQLTQQGHQVLDVRSAGAFGAGHVLGAINLGLGGQYASWSGSLLSAETPMVIVAEDEAGVDEAVLRLARVGIESVKGYLDGGMYAWDRAGLPVETIAQWPVDELHKQLEENSDLQVVDVRRPAEYNTGHVPGAISAPLARLEAELGQLSPELPTAVVCASGYRSSAATSILGRHGFHRLYNVVGGTTAWRNAGYPVEEGAAETTQAGHPKA